ncbi:MAG: ATP-dependent DNA helicase [Methanocellales archaeon]|nr:ATP-dependent DNA helicase [Methanocellales archaeon]MDD3420909.1 ATP-dependent DNA helicase [Methanocellales archaeon]MDD4898293.1 ATP-dependent DNA helicase [Methanocellales archaeon]MDD5447207.1 ATP-dependent DNA helicase [Methanocellales archaeon]
MKISELSDQLPQSLIRFYVDSGFDELYPPQADALLQGILDGKNMVTAIPTASGKTLLAEFAMLKSVLSGGKALYIVPLRALASEKFDRFSEFKKLGIKVGISTGDFDQKDEWLGTYDIIVATSEKADSLLRNEVSWMPHLTVIVADEIHLINSADRGPTLEITLTKLMKLNPMAQILALSATIGNADELAGWLNAELVQSDWRPVELREGVLFGRAIKFVNAKKEISSKNKDEAIALSMDTIGEGGQCLIFTNTRRNSESMAKSVGRAIKDMIDSEDVAGLMNLAGEIREVGETDLGEKLASCMEKGAAFHHAGLHSEHRRIIEGGFRSNLVKAIACTPTLASGLNLPARRVIIRNYKRYDLNFGSTPIPVLEIKQMCGRAGRPGLDPYGESVLIARNLDELNELMENYVLAYPERIWSKLGTENALRTHILSTIATGFALSRSELFDFMDATFYGSQQERWSIEHVIDAVLEFLESVGMSTESDGELHATQLGKLVSKLYIDPLSASIIINALRSMQDPTLLTLLHLVCRTPDMRKLYLRSKDYIWVQNFAEEHDREFLYVDGDEWFLAEVKTAMMFLDWIDEVGENDITKRFGIGPGDIRTLTETAEWLVHSTAELSAFLKLPFTKDARHLVMRIKYGINQDLLKLVTLRGVGRVRARRLYDAGFTDLDKLKNADPKNIGELVGNKIAINILEQLGVSLDEKLK